MISKIQTRIAPQAARLSKQQYACTHLPPNWQLICLGLLLALITFSSCSHSKEKPTLTIYAAASLSELVVALGQAFDPHNAYRIYYNFASSGALAKQLIATAKADLFLSASTQWMQVLAQAKLIHANAPRNFVSNQLCLIAHPNADFSLSAPQQIGTLDFQYLALGDPSYVPAGVYGQQWLNSLSDSLQPSSWRNVQDKLLPASDVRAVVAAVAASSQIIGLVYLTDYLVAQQRVQLLYTIPTSEALSINYQVSVLNSRLLSREFLAFLASDCAQAIFRSQGFIPPAG